MSIKLDSNALELKADVLVLGGGPAACWAAWAAASQGAQVVLADKGYCGTSGATAPSGTGVWVIPPEGKARLKAKAEREAMGGYLADHGWMDRVLDRTWRNTDLIAEWGYVYPQHDGVESRRSLQGPEYMRILRKAVLKAGVKVLDQSPALELLIDRDGTVAGASGLRRQEGGTWTVRAGAVVLATGGCAWLSKALGCNTNTGDGYLFAAEAGGELSGMEFSNHYSITTKHSSITKGAHFSWAIFTDEAGNDIYGIKNGYRSTSTLAKGLLKGKVFAQLIKAKGRPEVERMLRLAQPNFFLQFDRAGINPFEQRFEINLLLEGTVRGTGGIRLTGNDCATTVPGLYAAGDAAAKEPICGGFTGGGSHNAAWAISSGHWAGEGAAAYAKGLGAKAGEREVKGTGTAGLRSTERGFDSDAVVKGVQDEVFPYEKNLFRSEPGLIASLGRLERLWKEVQAGPGPLSLSTAAGVQKAQKAREAVALLASARWSYVSALDRKETRGMHRRTDFPQVDPNQRHHIVTSGLDTIHLRHEAAAEFNPIVLETEEVVA